jgi:signal transduction histidine kinase
MNGFSKNSSGQLRWVISLLAIAVILPTVCLLWFMTQAVENVRMAARQILIDEYGRRVADLAGAVDEVWAKRTMGIETRGDSNAVEAFASLVLDEPTAEGVLVYDGSGELAYPILDSSSIEPEPPEELTEAWELEFVEGNFTEAANIYMNLAAATEDEHLRRKARLGAARCYRKRGLSENEMARIHCEAAGYDGISSGMSGVSVSLAAKARVMLAEMLKDAPARSLALPRLVDTASNYEPGSTSTYFLPMDSGTRMFIQTKAIQLAEASPDPNVRELRPVIEKTKKLLAAERLSAEAAQRYSEGALLRQWAPESVHRLDVSGDIYGSYRQAADRGFLLLWSADRVRRDFGAFEDKFTGSDVTYEVLDDAGRLFTGREHPTSEPFVRASLGSHFPGWQVRLYFRDADVFEKAASRQAAIYIWAGVLVIVLILAAGGFAAQALGRQMKLNRLKNDFIATVSHELKTPLASMRVLADTLLDGNYKDQQQAKEYLELICKENRRLSGLIDNFLTFSRMERNKRAFDMSPTSPADIASAAADAVKTKFAQYGCHLRIEIAEDLPDVPADRDAMATVLVNLLDNACKYSYDDKQIELKAFAEDGLVCFSVNDNGIGMTRRQIRKIFDRFYQADRSLSRRAEGCGLGLSIAKFIVDAHKGTITVESKPGKGSTFTVKLPAPG